MKELVVVLILASLLCCSCQSNQFDALIGSHIALPMKSTCINSINTDDAALINKKCKRIVVLINGTCPSCYSRLNDWNQLVKQNPLLKKHLVFVVEANDDFEIFQFALENSIRISHPLFLDVNHELKSELMKHPKVFPTVFLLDENNNISQVGNPLDDSELIEIYGNYVK